MKDKIVFILLDRKKRYAQLDFFLQKNRWPPVPCLRAVIT